MILATTAFEYALLGVLGLIAGSLMVRGGR